MYEAFVESWVTMDFVEYAVIVVIATSMMKSFMGGLGLGVLLACGFFVVQCSQVCVCVGSWVYGSGKECSHGTSHKAFNAYGWGRFEWLFRPLYHHR
jgi:MFS superfamily sulfate permease-like transporter